MEQYDIFLLSSLEVFLSCINGAFVILTNDSIQPYSGRNYSSLDVTKIKQSCSNKNLE